MCMLDHRTTYPRAPSRIVAGVAVIEAGGLMIPQMPLLACLDSDDDVEDSIMEVTPYK